MTQKLPDAEFKDKWNEASSVDELAIEIGYTKNYATQRASQMRKRGFKLKRWSKGTGILFIPLPGDIAAATKAIREKELRDMAERKPINAPRPKTEYERLMGNTVPPVGRTYLDAFEASQKPTRCQNGSQKIERSITINFEQ
jgi:hypothetical protein